MGYSTLAAGSNKGPDAQRPGRAEAKKKLEWEIIIPLFLSHVKYAYISISIDDRCLKMSK